MLAARLQALRDPILRIGYRGWWAALAGATLLPAGAAPAGAATIAVTGKSPAKDLVPKKKCKPAGGTDRIPDTGQPFNALLEGFLSRS